MSDFVRTFWGFSPQSHQLALEFAHANYPRRRGFSVPLTGLVKLARQLVQPEQIFGLVCYRSSPIHMSYADVMECCVSRSEKICGMISCSMVTTVLRCVGVADA